MTLVGKSLWDHFFTSTSNDDRQAPMADAETDRFYLGVDGLFTFGCIYVTFRKKISSRVISSEFSEIYSEQPGAVLMLNPAF